MAFGNNNFIKVDSSKKADGIISVTEYLTNTDGTIDQAQLLRDSVTAAKAAKKKLHVPRWVTVRVDSTVDLTGLDLDIQGFIKSYVNGAPAIIIGGDSRNSNPITAFINNVSKGNTLNANDIGVQVVGIKNGKITIMADYYTQLYTDINTVGRTSISYSDFWFGKIDVLELYGTPGVSWITDCNFFGGRYGKIIIGNVGGTYNHNNNVFYKPCVEGGEIRIIKGMRNIFYDVRTESGTNIYFEVDSSRNIIYDNYTGSYNYLKGSGIIVYDNGFENAVLSSLESVYIRVPIATIDANTLFLNNVSELNLTDQAAIVKNANKKFAGTAWKALIDFSIDTKYIRRIGFNSDATMFRTTATMKDNAGVIIDDSTGISSAGALWDATLKRKYFSANIAGTEYGILSSTAKTVDISISMGGTLTRLEFERLVVWAEVKRENTHYVDSIRKSLQNYKFSKLIEVGSTRPSAPMKGEPFFDSTINKSILWDGTNWRDSATGTIV